MGKDGRVTARDLQMVLADLRGPDVFVLQLLLPWSFGQKHAKTLPWRPRCLAQANANPVWWDGGELGPGEVTCQSHEKKTLELFRLFCKTQQGKARDFIIQEDWCDSQCFLMGICTSLYIDRSKSLGAKVSGLRVKPCDHLCRFSRRRHSYNKSVQRTVNERRSFNPRNCVLPPVSLV